MTDPQPEDDEQAWRPSLDFQKAVDALTRVNTAARKHKRAVAVTAASIALTATAAKLWRRKKKQ